LIILSFIAYLEIRWRKRNYNKIKILEESYSNLLKATDRKALIKYDLNAINNLLKESPEINIVLYDNLLIDLTDFINIHPGGKYLIKSNQMSEIGRYLNNGQPISSNVKSHNHSFDSIKKMLDSFIIGTFENTNFFIYKYENETNLEYKTKSTEQIKNFIFDDFDQAESQQFLMRKYSSGFNILNNIQLANFYYGKIYFEEKFEIADKLWRLSFSLVGYKFPIFVKGFEWCGKYVTLASETSNISRNYTICLFLNDKNQELLKILYQNFLILEKIFEKQVFEKSILEASSNQNNINSSQSREIAILNGSFFDGFERIELEKLNDLSQNDLISERILLYVKSYEKFDGLSKELNQMRPNDTILLKAPIVYINYFIIIGIRIKFRRYSFWSLYNVGQGYWNSSLFRFYLLYY